MQNHFFSFYNIMPWTQITPSENDKAHANIQREPWAHVCISDICVVDFADGSYSIAQFILGKIDCSQSDLKRTQMSNDVRIGSYSWENALEM